MLIDLAKLHLTLLHPGKGQAVNDHQTDGNVLGS